MTLPCPGEAWCCTFVGIARLLSSSPPPFSCHYLQSSSLTPLSISSTPHYLPFPFFPLISSLLSNSPSHHVTYLALHLLSPHHSSFLSPLILSYPPISPSSPFPHVTSPLLITCSFPNHVTSPCHLSSFMTLPVTIILSTAPILFYPQ